MAKDDDKLIIEIELDDGKLAKGFVNAERVAKKSGKKAGKDFSKGVNDNAGQGLDNLTSRLKGLGFALAAAFGARETIAASSRQQAAINKLETSLRSIGEYTPQVSREMQNFAAELQKTTKFGDEATLEQLAFAQAMGATADQSKDIVAAAMDMSAALDIDFNSAVRNIAKTLGGFAGELGEVIPELKDLSKEQLQAGDGVNLLAEKYKGFANKELKDFDAKLEQAKNTLGDFGEALGDLVTKSDASVGFLDDMSIAVSGLTATLKSYTETDAKGAIDEQIQDTEKRITALKGTIENAEKGNEGFLASIFGGPDTEVLNERLTRLQSNLSKLQEKRKEIVDEEKSVIKEKDKENTDKLSESLQKLIDKYKEMGYSADLAKQIAADPEWQNQITASNQTVALSFSQLNNALKAEAKKIKITSGQMASTMMQGIGNGAGQAFAAFGKALAEGENALEAMLNSFLSSMGQMAIQVGTQFIMQGLAYQLAGMPNGGPLMAAGAALAAFGGVMGAIGGKSEGSETSTLSSGYSVGTSGEVDRFDNDETLAEDNFERRADPSVNVTIQGNVLDGDESGLKIVEMINKAVKEQGAALA